MYQIGDTVEIPWAMNTIKHKGIVVRPLRDGRVIVAHNSKEHGRVVLSDLQSFSSGQPVTISNRPVTAQDKLATAQRAMSRLNEPYHPTLFNCDHHTTFAQKGVAESPQLRGILVTLAIAVGVGLAIKASA